jgi:hypothetical protein
MAVNPRTTGLWTLWLALFVCPWAMRAQAADHWRSGPPRGFFTTELATTLDSDNQADWIRAYPCPGPSGAAAFCVRVAVSETRSTQTIVVRTNAKGVHVTSHDVNGDHLQDVLVMSADDGRPLGVWINDGHGGFEKSDPRLYPASVWHEDPLLCPESPPERATPAALNGVQYFYLAPFVLTAPLPEADRSFNSLEVASPRSARFDNCFGRAPPVF